LLKITREDKFKEGLQKFPKFPGEEETVPFGGYQRFPTGARGNPKSSACGARCLFRRSETNEERL
jgi:hypothetical protein